MVGNALATNTTSSVSVEGIFVKMLRLASPGALPHLAALINSSFQTRISPVDWKKALVIPLLKNLAQPHHQTLDLTLYSALLESSSNALFMSNYLHILPKMNF